MSPLTSDREFNYIGSGEQMLQHSSIQVILFGDSFPPSKYWVIFILQQADPK